jgi:hypothetical protein
VHSIILVGARRPRSKCEMHRDEKTHRWMEEENAKQESTFKYKDGRKLYLDDYFKDKTVLQKIRSKLSYLRTKISYSWYDLINGIKSMYRWRKAIWNDRTWGSSQIITILIFKIKMDRDAIQRRNLMEGTDARIESMNQVIAILEKYNSFDYDEEFRMNHEAKWGKDRHYFLELKDGNFEWRNERNEELTEDKLEIKQDELLRNIKAAEQLRKKDLADALFIMQREIDNWWD